MDPDLMTQEQRMAARELMNTLLNSQAIDVQQRVYQKFKMECNGMDKYASQVWGYFKQEMDTRYREIVASLK